MKKIITIGIFTLSNLIYAQSSDINRLSSFGRINAGLHGIDFSYELPISRKMVWENSFGAGMGSYVGAIGSTYGYQIDFISPTPYFKSELKYIYNIEKRVTKGKNTSYNSGNYIGLQTKYSFGNSKNSELNQTLLTEIHWSLQRSIGDKFLFGAHVGLGYLQDYDNENGIVTPTAGFRFGYVLF